MKRQYAAPEMKDLKIVARHCGGGSCCTGDA